jgi:two-component system chemotaxis sensor kinase CheA
MDLSQYAELFLAESREHLSVINQQLLEWERQPDAREPIGGIFRAVHTIKGMAATMGFGAVAEVAHGAENLLDQLRSGEHVATDDLFQLLFRATDLLERAIDASVAGREGDIDAGGLIAELDAAGHALGPMRRPSRPSMQLPSSQEGAGIWVRVAVDADSALKGARAAIVVRRLEALGTVHAVQPAPSAFETDEFDGRFDVRIDTAASEADLEREVRAAGDIAGVEITGGEAASRTPEAGGRTRHVRVDLRRIDSIMNLVGELVTVRDQLTGVTARLADSGLDDVTMEMARLTGDLQTEVIQSRMTPVWQVFDRFPRLVRDVARQLGKQVDFDVEGKEIELDRAILDELGDPLVHLLRNAVDHGIERPADREAAGKPPRGRLMLAAVRERAAVAIRVQDDGRGIDAAKVVAEAKASGLIGDDVETISNEMLLKLLARPGFTTAAEITDVSGRGVGIDVVATRLRALGGAVELRSEPGVGSTFVLRVPTTLAIVRALTARVGDERYVLPITHVAETLELDPLAITELEGRDAMVVRDDVLSLVDLRALVGAAGNPPSRRPVIVLQIGERRSGLVVDALTGQQEIVVKPFEPPRGTLPIFSGATILGDGKPVLILDAGGLVA